MKLFLVEHAQTYENRRKISQGQLNTQLTKEGIGQARKLALRLKEEKIDFAYSSDLDRAVKTAEEILKFHKKIKLKKEKRLRERHKGIYQGKPNLIVHKAIRESGLSYTKFDFGGGETLIQVQKRIKNVYNVILKKHRNDNVLIVSHGEPIISLLLYLLNKPIENEELRRSYQPKHGSLTILDATKKNINIEIFNSVEHLLK